MLKTGLITWWSFNFLLILAMILSESVTSAQTVISIKESLDISLVPSGFPVGFCLFTQGNRQYVAYYDAEHRMTVATRMLDQNRWQYRTLPTNVGWDSHNYIVMAIDEEGYIHLSGNMHVTQLIYFRTSQPWDIATFQRISSMTGQNETRCTYPQFMRDAENRLIFHYRDGSSGNGNEIYNIYDTDTQTWRKLLDQPLTDGQGQMNAYMTGPSRGPDGWFHLGWVWRDTPDCKTNHDPSYARSRNLIDWETIDGQPLKLPITIQNHNTLIESIPSGGGIINGALRIGFDSHNQPLASYHKFDHSGNTQVYIARFEQGCWNPYQITQWDYRWEFSGGGSIPFEIGLGAVESDENSRLKLPYHHIKKGSGLLIIDEKTLKLIGIEKSPSRYPSSLGRPESTFPGIRTRWAEDSGSYQHPTNRYVLRWETLSQNRDHKPEGLLPDPVMLRLYCLSQNSD